MAAINEKFVISVKVLAFTMCKANYDPAQKLNTRLLLTSLHEINDTRGLNSTTRGIKRNFNDQMQDVCNNSVLHGNNMKLSLKLITERSIQTVHVKSSNVIEVNNLQIGNKF